jgi:hypothetical protein
MGGFISKDGSGLILGTGIAGSFGHPAQNKITVNSNGHANKEAVLLSNNEVNMIKRGFREP